MSLIDQALKKTQSLLHKQKSQASAASESIARTTHNVQMNSSADKIKMKATAEKIKQGFSTQPTFKKNTFGHSLRDTVFKMPRLNPIWIMGAALAFILMGLVYELYSHVGYIEKGIGAVYKDVEHVFSSPPKVQIPKKPDTIPAAVLTKSLVLNGIAESSHQRVAVINQHLYHLNESIDGFTIKRIHYNYVTLINPITHQQVKLIPDLS